MLCLVLSYPVFHYSMYFKVIVGHMLFVHQRMHEALAIAGFLV